MGNGWHGKNKSNTLSKKRDFIWESMYPEPLGHVETNKKSISTHFFWKNSCRLGRKRDLVHLPVTHVWNYYKQSHLLETWKVNLACHAFQMSSCTFWRKRWSSTGRLRFLNPWMWFCRSCIHWFLVFSSFYLLAICSIGGCKSTFPAFKRIDIYCRSPLPRNCFINLRLVLIIYNL